MAYDGIQYNNRVDGTTERKLNAKIVDTILSGRTYASRLLGMGKPMMGKTYDYTVKITDSGAGQFFTGLESLNTAASDTFITLSYAHTAFMQPAVSIMLESFANSGPTGTINLDAAKLQEATAEAIQKWGHSIYGNGTGNQPNGLGAIVDDATDVGTIGGQSRTTYSILNASRGAASGGALSLSGLATREDAVTAAGLETEEPNLNVTTKTAWSLFEQLQQPQVVNNYNMSGGDVIALRGNDIMKRADLKGQTGFTTLAWRGKPVIKDDDCTSGNWFMLNERYHEWRGRTVVPEKYQGKIERVSLNEGNLYSGVAGSSDYVPPSSVGWFFQPYQMLPQQAGMVARFYCIGQVCASQPRRNGRITGITTV